LRIQREGAMMGGKCYGRSGRCASWRFTIGAGVGG
jgi:hypothetical protein